MNDGVRSKALDLFGALFEKRYGIKEAIIVAKTRIASSNKQLKMMSLEWIEPGFLLSFAQLFLKIKDNPEISVSVFSVLSLLVVMMKLRSDSR